jgi:hypothetical protein
MSHNSAAITRLRTRLDPHHPAIAMASHNPLAVKLAAHSCAAKRNIAAKERRVAAISATLVCPRSAEPFYEPSELIIEIYRDVRLAG